MWWWFWALLEIIRWAISLILEKLSVLKFLIWQRLSSIFLFFSMSIIKISDFTMLALFFKIAIPPLHSWFLSFINNFPWIPFILFILFSKLPLIAIYIHTQHCNIIFIIIIIVIILFSKAWGFTQIKFYLWACFTRDFMWLLISLKRRFLYLGYILIVIIIIFLLMFSWNKFLYVKILIFITGTPFFRGFIIKLLILSVYLNIKISILLIFNILYLRLGWILILLIRNTKHLTISKLSPGILLRVYFILYFWWFFY